MGDPGPVNGRITSAKLSMRTAAKKLSTTTKTKPLFLSVDQSLAKMRRRKAIDLKSNDILNPEIDLKKALNSIYSDQVCFIFFCFLFLSIPFLKCLSYLIQCYHFISTIMIDYSIKRLFYYCFFDDICFK